MLQRLKNMSISTLEKYSLPKVQRPSLETSFKPTNTGQTIRFEVAVAEDIPVITSFLLNEYRLQAPVNVSQNISADELLPFLMKDLEQSIPQGASVLAIEDGYLCGVSVSNIQPIVRTEWKDPLQKEDYGKDLEKCKTGSEKMNYQLLLVKITDEVIGQNIPEPLDRYLRIDMLSVIPTYGKSGIGRQLVIQSCHRAVELGLDFAQMLCTAVASNKLAKSLGMKPIMDLHLTEFLCHGKRIFPDEFHDGGDKVTQYVAPVQLMLAAAEHPPTQEYCC